MESKHSTTASHQAEAGSAPEPRRVLVVDDSHDARAILELLLKKMGHLAATAEDGPSGIAIAREFHPDIVLCDITMAGGMSGYGFAKAAREDQILKETSLVAISGWDGEEHQLRAYTAGFDHVLKKPVEVSELERILQTPPRRAGSGCAIRRGS